jgi:CHAT domain-containing protein
MSTGWTDALESLFDSTAGRLIVMPGGLGGFPFELLHDSDGNSLGDLFDVSYSPSATVLGALESRTPRAQTFLALADPSAAGPGIEPTDAIEMRAAAASRQPLPQAREEAQRIAPPRGRVLVGDEATPTAMMNEGGAVSVLHLAMHASVDTQNPYASALLMAPDQNHAHGVLAVPEIAAATIDADLVSLSGCSTVGGYQVLGEGIFGLTRAFLEAGSRSVVASRWEVEDAAARRFMELFYGGLSQGKARDSALGAARRAMRDEGYGVRDRAAFALVGAVSGDLPVLKASAPAVLRWVVPAAVIAVVFSLLASWRRRRQLT